jgi:hypothetical protein
MRFTNKTKNLIKKVGILLLCVIAVGLVASAVVGAADDSDYKRTHLRWDVGGIDENGAYNPELENSIYTVKSLECSAISLAADFDSDISYSVYFYDENDEFIQVIQNDGRELEVEGDSFPETAVSVRIVITPNDDENGKIGLFEKSKYANQLTVKIQTED